MGDINFDLNRKESVVVIRVNPKLYPLNTIYSASYVFLDRCYIMLGGDPESEVVVELRPKGEFGLGLDVLAKEFFNELLNYAFYEEQSKKNAPLRNTLLQAALFSSAECEEEEIEDDVNWDELEGLDDEEIDDPEGIAVPWEEKYGDSMITSAASSPGGEGNLEEED